MRTHHTRPHSRALIITILLSLVLAASGARPAGAQGGTPGAPPLQAPGNPLALDSNPQSIPLAPPSNDNFDGAWAAGALTYYVTEDTSQATTQTADPSQSCTAGGPNQNSHSVWFQYTATSAAPLIALTYGSSYDTVLSAHTGTFGALTQVACNDDYVGNVRYSIITFTPVAGTTYYFDVTGYNNASGTLVFALRTAAAPGNDNFEQAVSVTPPYAAALDTTSATSQAEDPLQGQGAQPGDCAPAQNDISVWYKYTALSANPVTAVTYGSNYDTVLSAHTGVWPSLSQVACSDDQNGTVQSQISFTPTVGTTYYFDVTREKNATEPPIDWLNLQIVNAAPPPHDNFAGPRVIGAPPYSDAVSTAYATL